ncbi:MAG TPA: hypothetical protein VM261_04130 [Kofleriaceae bacterium]|nr:hypothetical protein [Kofleriaceae bacterium]
MSERENFGPEKSDPQLDLTLGKITTPEETRVAGRDGFKGYFVKAFRTTRYTALRTVDLIGHGDAGVLRMDDMVLNPGGIGFTFDIETHPETYNGANYGIERVRLLGCNTAETESGQQAMKYLAWRLSVPVVGTTDVLDATHYDERGLLPTYGKLADTTGPLPEAKSPQQVVNGWRQSLTPYQGEHAALIDRLRIEALPGALSPFQILPRALLGFVFANMSWAAWTIGLHAHVDHAFWTPVPGGAHRIDAIGRFNALRLYPKDYPADPRTLVAAVHPKHAKFTRYLRGRYLEELRRESRPG